METKKPRGYKVVCPYCGKRAELVDSREIYGDRSYGWAYLCRDCDAFVGCHNTGNKHTVKPKGTLADGPTRAARIRAHNAFDALWRYSGSGFATRTEAYGWLADMLSLSFKEAHIANFDLATCEKVISLAHEKNEAFIRRYQEVR